jgi:O-acetyl-ADP-ribose deacetylase (regulator of RNase III)
MMKITVVHTPDNQILGRNAQRFAVDVVYQGDIMSPQADAVVSPANSAGLMNGGVDKRYLDFFKRSKSPLNIEERVQSEIRRRYADGLMPIGEAFALRIRENGPMPGEPEFLIVAPTMSSPRTLSSTGTVYKATLAGLRAADEAGVRHVAFPGMGDGVGAGAHSDRGRSIEKMTAAHKAMERAFDDFSDIQQGRTTYENAWKDYIGKA